MRTRSALSLAPLPYVVSAQVDGVPWSPAPDSVFEGAYLSSPAARPGGADWVTGTFERSEIGAVLGLVMVGPGGKELAVGTWYEWARVTDPGSGVMFVESVGRLVIT